METRDADAAVLAERDFRHAIASSTADSKADAPGLSAHGFMRIEDSWTHISDPDEEATPIDDDLASSFASSISSRSTSSSSCSEDEVPLRDATRLTKGCLLYNPATRCYHILKGSTSLRCGRGLPKRYSIVSEVAVGARRCERCF